MGEDSRGREEPGLQHSTTRKRAEGNNMFEKYTRTAWIAGKWKKMTVLLPNSTSVQWKELASSICNIWNVQYAICNMCNMQCGTASSKARSPETRMERFPSWDIKTCPWRFSGYNKNLSMGTIQHRMWWWFPVMMTTTMIIMMMMMMM